MVNALFQVEGELDRGVSPKGRMLRLRSLSTFQPEYFAVNVEDIEIAGVVLAETCEVANCADIRGEGARQDRELRRGNSSGR